MVSWDILCQPKCSGRLGIRLAKSFNEEILIKLSWDIFRGNNSFWVEILKSKYTDHKNNKGASTLWKAIQNQEDYINKAMVWALGNGKRILA